MDLHPWGCCLTGANVFDHRGRFSMINFRGVCLRHTCISRHASRGNFSKIKLKNYSKIISGALAVLFILECASRRNLTKSVQNLTESGRSPGRDFFVFGVALRARN